MGVGDRSLLLLVARVDDDGDRPVIDERNLHHRPKDAVWAPRGPRRPTPHPWSGLRTRDAGRKAHTAVVLVVTLDLVRRVLLPQLGQPLVVLPLRVLGLLREPEVRLAPCVRVLLLLASRAPRADGPFGSRLTFVDGGMQGELAH